MFGRRGKARAIIDMDFSVTQGFHGMELAGEGAGAWPETLAAELTPDPGTQAGLAEALAFARARVAEAEVGVLAAVEILEPDSGRVDSVLAVHVSDLPPDGGPERYRDDLEADRGRQDSDREFLDVRTWMARSDTGVLVGAWSPIAYPGPEGSRRGESRIVLGVFPPQSSQFVEFMFTRGRADEDPEPFIEQANQIAATLIVVLGKV